MIRDNKEFVPSNDEQSEVMKNLEEKLQKLETKIKARPKYLKSPMAGFIDTGIPMSDRDIDGSLEFLDEVSKQSSMENLVIEIKSRLQDIENVLPEFKGLNTFDVPLATLKDTATLPEVISVINKLIQRDVRQDRLK